MRKLLKLWIIICISTGLFSITFIQSNAATGADIVSEAEKWIGTQYGHSDGSGGPGTSADCSGLTLQVYKKFGYNLEWSSQSQANAGTYVDKHSLQPGDLVCFSYSDGSIGHVGIYVGNDSMIHAPGSGRLIGYGNYISTWTYENGGCKLEYGRRIVSEKDSPSEPQTTGISNPNQIIRYGNSGTSVRELQQALNSLINAGLDVDGKFGDATLAAVRHFQSLYSLTVDGDAGPNTNNKINELIQGQQKPTKASIPTNINVSLNGQDVTVSWNLSSDAIAYNVYLVQEPWGWNDILLSQTVSSTYTSYTFENIEPGEYAAFVIAMPNDNTAQSKWYWFSIPKPHIHSYTEINYETDHPHKEYAVCSCGDIQYTGNVKTVSTCLNCLPSNTDSNTQKTLKLQIGIPQMIIDGIRQEIDPGRDTAPIIVNSRTLLPVRAIVEAFDAYISWSETGEVTIHKDDIIIKLWIDSYTATVNNKNYTIDVAPVIINDRTFMPIRFIAEKMGLTVDWNKSDKTITIEGN